MKGTLIRFSIIPFFIGSIFGSLSIVNLINLFKDRDFYFNHSSYEKVIARFENIDFDYGGDMNQITFYGFGYISNYDSIFVYFDHRGNQYFYENSKVPNLNLETGGYNDTKYHYVWYRQGHPKAYPALPNETRFPVWQRLNKELRLTYFWLFCLIVTFILWKIGVKMGFMKNEINEE